MEKLTKSQRAKLFRAVDLATHREGEPMKEVSVAFKKGEKDLR